MSCFVCSTQLVLFCIHIHRHVYPIRTYSKVQFVLPNLLAMVLAYLGGADFVFFSIMTSRAPGCRLLHVAGAGAPFAGFGLDYLLN